MATPPVTFDFSKAVPIEDFGAPSQAGALQGAVAYGATQNPDEFAKLLALQKQTGIGPQLAQGNEKQVQQAADVNKIHYQSFAAANPRTTSWASNPDNAAVSGVSGVQGLGRIEQNAGSMRALTPMESFNYKYIFPVQQKLMQYPLTRMAIDAVGGAAGMAGNIGSFFGVHGDNQTKQNLLQRIESNLAPEQAGNWINGAPDTSNGMDWLAKNVAPMIPAVLATGGTSLLARTLGLSETAAKVLGGLTVGGMFDADQAGKTYTAVAGSGGSDIDARSAANKVAAISAIPNALFGATDVVPLLRDNPLLTSLGLGGATGATGQVGQNVVTGQPWNKGVAGAAVQGAAMQGGMHLGTDAFSGNLAEAVNAAEQSKLRERSPEKFDEAMQAIFAGDQSLRVPAEQFSSYFKGKGMDPAQVAKGLSSSNYTEAMLSGGDVEISRADFLSKLDSEHQKALLQDIVVPGTGLTARQHQEGLAELEQWATGGGAAKLVADTAAADAETAATPEYQEVKEQIRQRYADAGETPEVAETLATKDANAYSNLARTAGMKPSELLNLYNPKVTVGEAPNAVLYQSGVPIDGHEGKETTLLTPSREIPAKYRLVEADDLKPSHDAQTFAKNPGYPDGLQERAYDTSKEAQTRVIQQAQNYDPRYTVNSNPDAVNGPPVVTPEGIVLGGNSRAMSTQRLYAKDGSTYKNALKEQAAGYGFTPEQVEGMKKPVLVRQVESPATPDEARRLGSELNKSMTGAMGVSERAVSAGKNIKPETLRNVANMMQADDSTLREAMGKHGSEIVKMLTTDGVITDRERPQFVDAATGGLNEEGKTFVERALMGSVIDDPRLMDSAPKSVLQKLERSLGSITSFASRADEWNLLPAIREAVGELGSIQREGTTVDMRLGQTSLFGEERNPLVDAMIRALDGKPNDVRKSFDQFARDSDENMPGQARMFGEANAFDAFNHAFGSKLTEQEYHDGLEEAVTEAPVTAPAADAQSGEGLPGSADSDTAPGSAPGAPGGDRPSAPVTVPPATPRGWLRVLPDGTYEIGKTKIGDLSTFVHEPAHAFLDIFGELVKRDGASFTLKADYQKILDFVGAKDGDTPTREQHETWARATEQYLREGKAPSQGLTRVFQRFAVWLHSIYKKATDLGVELTPEIRGVMDRLYASEEGVNKAESEAGPKLFSSAEEAGWTEEQFKAYAEDKNVGVEQAKSEILRKLNDAALRDKTESWREEEKNVREAVTADVDSKPEYKAIRALRKGELTDGAELTINKDELVKQFGEDRVKALQEQHRGLYRIEGGTDPESAAEMLGFGSAEEMVRTLEATPRRSAAIEEATRAYMTAKHGDIRYDGTLADQARIALESDQKAASLHKELTVLKQKVAEMKGKTDAMRAIEVAPIAAYREAAHQMIESKAIADLQPGRYLDASRRYSREAFDAARRQDAQAAADAKHKELMNHFLFREASKAADYVGKFESYTKRMQSRGIQQRLGLADASREQRGEAGSDFRDQFNWLLARYKLSGPMQAPERSLRAWAEDAYGAGNEPGIAPGILNDTKFADYRRVPLSEVRDLHDALINVRHLAMQEFKMYVQGKQVDFAEAKNAMMASARENNTSKPVPVLKHESDMARLGREIHSVAVSSTRMEFLINKLDGGTEGPWHDNLWNLYADAKGDEFAMQHDFTQAVNDHVEAESKRQGLRLNDKVTIEGIPVSESWTRKDLVSAALNMGNEGNLDRLNKTFIFHGWDPEAVRRIGGMLTGKEWDFVQGIWNSLKPYGERMNEMEKRLTGLAPTMVEVKPFTAALDDGTEKHLDGGYYPIHIDPESSLKGYDEEAGKMARNLMQTGYGRATTSRGYTKERTGFGGPLLLDYERVLTSHIAKTTKDISHREFMMAANKLLIDPEIRQTLRETLGPAYEEQFMPWLRATVNDRNGSLDFGSHDPRALLGKLKSNLVTASLGFKVSTNILQLTHLPRIMLYTKPGSFTSAMVDFWKNPIEMTRTIKELSPNEMRFRGDNLDRDYRAKLQEIAGKKSISAAVTRFAFAGFKYIDHVISFPLWNSVYNDTLAAHADLSESEAHKLGVHAADGAVRMGIGTGTAGDLPPIMRSDDFLLKMETMMYGFHNLNYNILRYKVADNAARDWRQGNRGAAVGKLTAGAALAWIVPAIVSSYVQGNGPKDGENWGLWAAKRSLLFGAGTLPFLKDAASLMEHGSLNPMLNFAQRGLETYKNAVKDGEVDKTETGIEALQIGGEAAGIPGTDQAAHIARYAHRTNEGKIENPSVYGALVAGH